VQPIKSLKTHSKVKTKIGKIGTKVIQLNQENTVEGLPGVLWCDLMVFTSELHHLTKLQQL